MTLEIGLPENDTSGPGSARIAVIGVGGAGGNAVNNMIRSRMDGVEFMAGNTDAQALGNCQTPHTLQLGPHLTGGLGCGANVERGRLAAEESIDDIHRAVSGYNLVFVAAGMGGGTGTGAAPVIARVAREQQALTVGVVTTPFDFEGGRRMRSAHEGLTALEDNVDCMVVIPNQNLFRVIDSKTTFADAFNLADGVLYHAIRSVTDLIVLPGLINLDFADVKTVMQCRGRAMMGVGEATGADRAVHAAEAAIFNPLLDISSIRGAQGVLINITGGDNMTLIEVDEATNRIRTEIDPDSLIIFGSTFDEGLDEAMRVTVTATGLRPPESVAAAPMLSSFEANNAPDT